MARTKDFDRDDVLERAMALFWAKGYDATSTEELLEAMGIGRQSLYDTFGDKRNLYLAALQRYHDKSVRALVRCLESADSPLCAIKELLLGIAAETPRRRALGCMGVNAIAAFGKSDRNVADLSRASAELVDSAFEAAIRSAKRCGEIDDSIDERAASRYLHTTLDGLRIRAKAGESSETLRDVAVFAIEALRPREMRTNSKMGSNT